MPALCRRVRPLLLACWCALSATVLAAGARGQTARSDELNPSEGPLSVQVEPALPLSPELLGRPVLRLEVVTAGGRWQAAEQLQKTPLGQPLSAAYARAVLREILSSGRYAEASASALPYGSAA